MMKLINESKGNSTFIWENINRITKKEDKSVQNYNKGTTKSDKI